MTLDYIESKKIRLLLKIFRVLMIVVGTMSLIRLIEQNYLQFWADTGFFFFIVFTYQLMKRNIGYYKILIRAIFFVSLLFAIFIMIHQPENPVRFIWLSTAIYMIFYLFDGKEAMHWIEVVGIMLAIAYIYDPHGFHMALPDFLTWLMNMVIVLMIAHWYAKVEEESKETFLDIQDTLSSEVLKKTSELRMLNESLEARIEEKIRKNAEQEKLLFRQARYAQMGEMISMIAHQWRQPLNTISVTTATMEMYIKMDQYDKAEFQKRISTISGSVHHLSKTIDDFRNFFKLDKEKQRLKFSLIIQNALGLVASSMERKNIKIHTENLCECTVFSYPNEIIHVVLNLLKNAEDALTSQQISEPRITIRAYNFDDRPCMEIEDNAGGIPSDMIEKIFDPYFTTKENSDGTGLGLYMSKIIIEDHCHGKIEVENGKDGAIFRLVLPPYDNAENCS